MRNYILLLIVTALISCAPNKKSTPTYVDIHCNDCYVKIENMWYESPGSGKPRVYEYPFDGTVIGYKRVELYRFDSPNSCVRPIAYTNHSTDTTWIYIIENNDTIAALDNGGLGYCN